MLLLLLLAMVKFSSREEDVKQIEFCQRKVGKKLPGISLRYREYV